MRPKEILALLGMACVLLVLLTVGVGGAIATQRATVQVSQAVSANQELQEELQLFNEEASLQEDYFLAPRAQTQNQFDAVAQQITIGLHAADKEATTTADHAAVVHASVLQARFRNATYAFFTAIKHGHQTQAVAITNKTIEPLVTAMRQFVNAESTIVALQLAAAVHTFDTTERTVRTITIATFVLGFLMLILFWHLFRTYRQQLAAATQAEIAHLQQYALTDHLTGLGNHRAFAEQAGQALALAQRSSDELVLALIDIDDFKQINDQHGHSHGDEVLAVLGDLLRGGRPGDRAYRLGGDEFALILQPATEPGARTLLERLRQRVEQGMFGVTISMGFTTCEHGVDDRATLREKADVALYEAKRRGRNAMVSFSEIRDGAALLSTAKILAVRRLLAERRLFVLFQPIWRLDYGTILGYEALMRPADEYGLEGPQEAFDIAERIGRAPELDALCRESILGRVGELPAGALLFLNLLPQWLDHPLLAGEQLLDAVTAAGLSPAQIVLEITERSMTRLPMVRHETQRLRTLGFRIALDDVGRGSTGLEVLRMLPVEYLKIDRSVIAGALHDTTARSMLAAILAFAREAGTYVIAEGIETEEMLDFVDEAGRTHPDRHAHAVQGYLTGRPSQALLGTPTHGFLPRMRSVS